VCTKRKGIRRNAKDRRAGGKKRRYWQAVAAKKKQHRHPANGEKESRTGKNVLVKGGKGARPRTGWWSPSVCGYQQLGKVKTGRNVFEVKLGSLRASVAKV